MRLLLLLALLLTAACHGDHGGDHGGDHDGDHGGAHHAGDGGGDGQAIEARTSSPERYAMRGEVISLPREGDPQSAFNVRHEPIDDFKGYDGEVWGMDSMTMPFELGDGVSLDGIEAGDKVAFTLEVDFDGDVPQQIVDLRELPADTELEFRKARPPGEDAGDQSGD